MSEKERITITMDRYAELQRIKRENGDYKNKELDYAIKLTAAKLLNSKEGNDYISNANKKLKIKINNFVKGL